MKSFRQGAPFLTSSNVGDFLFPSDNAFGIPTLDPRFQADFLDAPVTPWGTIARTAAMGGTYHFYVDDYKFEALYKDPTPLVNCGCRTIVEPNFTTGEQMARALALSMIYKKRWIARYCQAFGVRVFVDLNVADCCADDNLLGVPHGWRAYATRGYRSRLEALLPQYQQAVCHAGTEQISFLVYGGGVEVRDLCIQQGWWYAHERAQEARGRYIHGQV